MSRVKYGIFAVIALLLLGALAVPAEAADVMVAPGAQVVVPPGAPVVVPLPTRVVPPRLATVPPPGTAYGCKRVWRCDAQVCEWRRGCWGVYGYVEGPYFSVALAKRQWTREGLPGR
jgi:hypothetical protein